MGFSDGALEGGGRRMGGYGGCGKLGRWSSHQTDRKIGFWRWMMPVGFPIWVAF